MDLLKELKNLKTISPDQGFSERSRVTILASERFDIFDFFRNNTRAGVISMAMVAFALFAIIRYISPTQMAKVDPRSLTAEAQAIDLQIKLSNLNLSAIQDFGNETTASGITKKITPSATSSETDSVEEILDILSE